MKTFLSVLLLMGFFTRAIAQDFTTSVRYVTTDGSNNPALIFYDPGSLLNWNDFKASPDENSIGSALTTAGFGYNMTFGTAADGKLVLTINVFCSFDKNASWVKPSGKNDYILKHEQHHFDISYIWTMHFIHQLEQLTINASNYRNVIKPLYRQMTRSMTDMQDQYDAETQHGILKDRQQAWSDKIDAELTALKSN